MAWTAMTLLDDAGQVVFIARLTADLDAVAVAQASVSTISDVRYGLADVAIQRTRYPA